MSKKYHKPKLGYDYGDLEPIYPKEVLKIHYEEHHQSYVDGANKAIKDINNARKEKDYDSIFQMKSELAFNLSGHVLHSIFWGNIAPCKDEKGKTDEIDSEIKKAFGDKKNVEYEMVEAGTSLLGSGWSALCWEPLSKSLIIEQIYDHHGNVGCGAIPILVMDMWEHAYYLKYKNDKKLWAKKFLEIINWSDINSRLKRVK